LAAAIVIGPLLTWALPPHLFWIAVAAFFVFVAVGSFFLMRDWLRWRREPR
jgi:hypothetical protein